MKKKRRYFSVVAVILLLANNTSGAAQVIAEELSKNNSSVEKIESSSEEQTAQSSNSEATEETNNNSEEQTPPSSSKSEDLQESTDDEEKGASKDKVNNQEINLPGKIETDKQVKSSEAKIPKGIEKNDEENISDEIGQKVLFKGNRYTEIEGKPRYTLPEAGTMNIGWDSSTHQVTAVSNNASIDILYQYFIDNPDRVVKGLELEILGSLSDAPRTIGYGTKDYELQKGGDSKKALFQYMSKLSGDIESIPDFGFPLLGAHKGFDSKGNGALIIDLPRLKRVGEYGLTGPFLAENGSTVIMPNVQYIGAYGLSFIGGTPDNHSNTFDFPNLKEIGQAAFMGNSGNGGSLVKINAPLLETIGDAAFANNGNLKEIYTPKISKLTGAPGAPLPEPKLEFTVTGISSIELNNLPELSRMMFKTTPNLKSIKVPNVKKIEAKVFSGQEGPRLGWPQVQVLKFNTPEFESINSDAFIDSNLRGILYNGTENNKKIFDGLNTTNRDGNRINFYGYKENIPDSKAKLGEKLSIPIVDLPEKVENAADDYLTIKLFKDDIEVSRDNPVLNNLKETGKLEFDNIKNEDAGKYIAIIEIQASNSSEKERYQTNDFKIQVGEEQHLWGTSPWNFDEESGVLTVEPGQLAEYNANENSAPWTRNDEHKVDPESIKKIVFTGETIAPKDARYLFSLKNLTKIDGLEKINTSETTDFGYMFQNATNIEDLDLSSWDVSKAMSFYCMFENAEKLKKLNVSTWKTKKVTSMSFTFKNAKSLKELDLSSWETFEEIPGVDYLGMNEMFKGTSLQKLTLGDHFKFRGTEASLGAPAGLNDVDKLTGNWIREDGKSKSYTPDKFMENFGQDDLKAGTYVAENKEQLVWGTAPWSFDEDSGTLTVEPGELAADQAWENQAPWNRKDDNKLPKDEIKKIVFTGKNVAPVNSSELFSRLENLFSIDGANNLDTSNVTDMSGMFTYDKSLIELNVGEWDTSNVRDMGNMFSNAKSLTQLDVSKWNTSNVTRMNLMFSGAESLTQLDVSKWNTSNVTSMNNMFSSTQLLEKIDVSEWNTGNVADMNYMFNRAQSLRELDVSKWNTSNVRKMRGIFSDARSLKDLDINKWDTGNVADMGQMFLRAWSLIRLDVSKWNTSNVTNMESMFSDANSLIELDVSKWDTSNVTSMYGVFQKTKSLTSLNVSEWNTSKVTDMRRMFSETAIKDLDLNEWDTSKVTEMSSMFQDSKDLENLKISKWNTGNVTDAQNMFSGLKLKRLTLGNVFEFKADAGLGSPAGLDGVENLTGNWIRQDGKSKGYSPTDFMANYGKNDELTAGTYVAEGDKVNEQLLWGTAPWTFDKETGTLTVEPGELIQIAHDSNEKNPAPWMRFDDRGIEQDSIKKIVFTGKNIAPVNSNNLFSSMPNLVSIEGLQNFDTSNVIYMGNMFYKDTNLTTLDVSKWDTSNVTDMSDMFDYASSLTTLDVSGWNTSKVTNMSSMFSDNNSLTTLDVSEWDTRKVTNMFAMFNGNNSLTTLDVSKWDTSNVTNMGWMFKGNNSLTTLDVSKWDTSNVTNMTLLFEEASSLTTLDVSKWITTKVTRMFGLFKNTSSLTTLDVSEWDTRNVTDMGWMFLWSGVTTLDVSKWDTRNVTDMDTMFGSTSLTTLDLSGWDSSNVTSMGDMFRDLKLKRLTLGDAFEFKGNAGLGSPAGLDGVENLTGKWIREDGKSKGYSPTDFMANYGKNDELTAGTYVAEKQLLWGTAPWTFDKETGILTVESGELADKYATENPFPWKRTDDNKLSKDEIKKIVFTGKVTAPKNSEALLANLTKLEEISGLKNLDTSNATNMQNMFALTSSITQLDLSGFRTSNVLTMHGMFDGMSALVSLDLSSFDTSQVEQMGFMFRNDISLKNINLSSFDTSKTGLMYSMFLNNKSLTELDLSSFDTRTKKQVSMADMFKGVTGLSKLKLGKDFIFHEKVNNTPLSPNLEAPVALNSEDEVNGKWVREDGNSKGYTPTDFMKHYGRGTGLTSGTYVAQTSRFGFKEVPEKMSFKETKISNRTTLTQRQDPEWKMIVEDTRPASSNWHVTAKMEEGFKDSKGNLLDSDLLLFRKNGQDDQWINSTSETMVYEGKGSPVRDDHEISWGEKEGPLIQAAPGAVKAEDYKGEITWNLVDAPL